MSKTSFSGPLYVGGVPVPGGDALVRPGTAYFVDGTNGSDGNDGKSIARAVKTLSKAYGLCTSNAGDVIYVAAASTGISESSGLTFDKNYVSIIGLDAPNPAWSFARINFSADASPGVTVSGQRNYIRGIRFNYGRGTASNLICATVSGAYNVFERVHFAGPMNATEAGAAGYRNVYISQSDNVFLDCTFGLDSVVLTTTNFAQVEFANVCARNLFRGCMFEKWIPNAGCGAGVDDVLVATGPALSRYARFEDCTFISFCSNWTGAAAGAINSGDGTAGIVLLKDCAFLNYTNIHSTGTARVYSVDAIPATGNQGLAVAVS